MRWRAVRGDAREIAVWLKRALVRHEPLRFARLRDLVERSAQLDPSFRIGTSVTGEQYIECARCDRRSFNPHDVRARYCAACRAFLVDST